MYIVFARKYRPQTFAEIIGQSHITTTLANAISQNRVAHAYLFAGPRGIGKTTTARILAKALDCEKGPTTSPCNHCASCNEITNSISLDILEIDGASNRGIEEIRNLRDNIKFAPSRGKYKIYIIDEVHMLTAEAFNALLKTLEEPPPHVKFIFATTQPHKVPPTILSRCQRFDFRRISTKDIFENLKRISGKEGLKTGDEVLSLIARYADGSMRDAEVILDQITSFATTSPGTDEVKKILGLVGEDVLFGLSTAIKEKDAVSGLKIIDELINTGKDSAQIITGLIEHFRNLAVLKISKDLSALVEVAEEKVRRYEDEARKFSIEEILYAIYTLANAIDFVRKSNMGRVPLEAGFIKLARMGPVASLDEITKRIAALEGDMKADPGPAPCPEKASKPAPIAEDPVENSTKEALPGRADSIDGITGSWGMVLSRIKEKKISVASYLQRGYPAALENAVLSIGFPKECSFYKEALDSPDYRQLIEGAIKEVSGTEVRVKFITPEVSGIKNNISEEYPKYGNEGDKAADEPHPQEGHAVEPIIKDALQMFNGRLKKV